MVLNQKWTSCNCFTATHEISNWEPLTEGKGNSWLGTWRYKTVGNPVQTILITVQWLKI